MGQIGDKLLAQLLLRLLALLALAKLQSHLVEGSLQLSNLILLRLGNGQRKPVIAIQRHCRLKPQQPLADISNEEERYQYEEDEHQEDKPEIEGRSASDWRIQTKQ
ncbi:hypothetical protein D3C78_1055870 [compost metagenome]